MFRIVDQNRQVPIMNQPRTRKPFSRLALGGLSLLAMAAAVGVAAPLGSRFGYWNYDFAVVLLEIAAGGFVAAGILCLAGLVVTWPGKTRRGFLPSLLGVVIVASILAMLGYWYHAKSTLPPIQDISTDTENPPEFWFAPNSQVYDTIGNAAYQLEAYPDIEPLKLDIPPEKTYQLVIDIIKDRGWKLWPPDRAELHVEATATTFWFGFHDDIVIHITPTEDGGSLVNMRSASRFGGGGDGGTNANRIRSFFRELKKRAQAG
jgi:uncharacterized protein (DUF1499 family)